MIWIAVDAMGGDMAPGPIVDGALAAARHFDLGVALAGPSILLESELARHPDVDRSRVRIVDAPDVVAMADAVALIRDFQRIRVDRERTEPFTPQHSQALFDRTAAWLEAELQRPFDGPTVVVTHHAPSPRSIHARFEGSPLNGCFVSDLERLMGPRVSLWIHGHTHDSFDYTVRGTRVVCNPRGYVLQGAVENAAFDPALVVEV